MSELLTLIITWLAINFALPLTDVRPDIEFATPAEMARIRQISVETALEGNLVAKTDRAMSPEISQALYAFYDSRSRTIYLPEGWLADSPRDVSILVHELVHHLQNLGQLEYACAEARERPAYEAQARWLEIFGETLFSEFAMDPMTIHLRTHCMH